MTDVPDDEPTDDDEVATDPLEPPVSELPPGPTRYPRITIGTSENPFTMYERALQALTRAAVEDVDEFVAELDRDDVPADEYRTYISRWVTIV